MGGRGRGGGGRVGRRDEVEEGGGDGKRTFMSTHRDNLPLCITLKDRVSSLVDHKGGLAIMTCVFISFDDPPRRGV